MSNSFAGAKSVDDRRRRRLAQEGLEGSSTRASRRKSSRSSAASQSDEPAQLESSLLRHAASPVNTRLWREPWKYVALLVALLLFDVGLVRHSSWTVTETAEATTLHAAEEWIVDHLTIGYFAACAGAGWVIFFHRSRSRLDFCGRYRLWIWLAVFWTVTTACSLTGWHERWGDWLAGRTRLTEWNGQFWCWLVPAAAALLSSTYLLKVEFTSCRAAWRLHCTCLVAAVMAVIALLLIGTSLEASWIGPSATLATILWPTLELGSLLSFARHVVYVSNEPAAIVRRKRTSKFTFAGFFRRFIAWLLAPREELPAYGEAVPGLTPRRKRSPRKKPARRTRKSAATSSGVMQPKATPAAPEPQSARHVEKPVAPVPPTRVESPAAITQQPVVPQASSPPPKQAAPPAGPGPRPQQVSKPAESRGANEVRVDQAQAMSGPHFTQSRGHEERESVAVVRQQWQQMEDDFGDVDDWDEDESDEQPRQRRKHKKKHRR